MFDLSTTHAALAQGIDPGNVSTCPYYASQCSFQTICYLLQTQKVETQVNLWGEVKSGPVKPDPQPVAPPKTSSKSKLRAGNSSGRSISRQRGAW